MISEQSVVIDVSQQLTLEARLAVPASPGGGIVICHPHPLYGGDMDNPVVVRVQEVCAELGLATLRFNFRSVGGSTGSHANGVGEQDDAVAALHVLAKTVGDRPLAIAGYSFGARVAARDDHDVAEIEVVRGDEHRRHLALAVRGIDQDLARDEAEGVLALARMLDEHDGSEGAASLG